MEARMRKGQFSFDDFLQAQKMLRRMGPLQGVLKMIPGLGQQLAGVDLDERMMKHVEAIVLSMTPQERRLPHVIDGKRRLRIAKGSGTTVQDVNRLLAARKQMEKMMKQLGKGKMPVFPGMPGR
jgi:signal recognition particle subunit SRP54